MPDPIRILFVDDEPQVLQGLQRLFRPQRSVWQVRTAGSGAEALAVCEAEPADVVVSDMRMPGMDGVALLAEVRERHPQAVRIMLTGQADHEGAIIRAGPCHHFVSKPCDHDRLMAIVNRAIDLRRELRDGHLAALMAAHPSLPTLPRLWRAMLDELALPEPSMPRLAGLVAQEPATAARLLRVVNSAAFGLKRTVGTVSEAVALLGLGAIRAMVLAMHVYEDGTGDSGEAERLWNRCLLTARLARTISRQRLGSAEQADAAFTAGLLHDCGLLLLHSGFPRAAAASQDAASRGASRAAAEAASGGPPHDLAGAWLLLRWGLPDELVEAAAWHHRLDRQSADPHSPLEEVRLAVDLLEARLPEPELAERAGGGRNLAELRAIFEGAQP